MCDGLLFDGLTGLTLFTTSVDQCLITFLDLRGGNFGVLPVCSFSNGPTFWYNCCGPSPGNLKPNNTITSGGTEWDI